MNKAIVHNNIAADNSTAADSNALATSANATAITPAKGLLLLVGVVAVIAAFIALNHALGIAEFWVAFLFLLYWGSVEQMKFARLPKSIAGAAIGLSMGYLMQMLPIALGAAGGMVFLGAILLLIYAHIMHWLPIAINTATMLFLTVTTIPALQSHVDFADIAAALALGIGYFSGLTALGNLIKQRLATSDNR